MVLWRWVLRLVRMLKLVLLWMMIVMTLCCVSIQVILWFLFDHHRWVPRVHGSPVVIHGCAFSVHAPGEAPGRLGGGSGAATVSPDTGCSHTFAQRLELGAAEVIGGKQKMHEQSGKMKHTTCGIRHGDRCRGKAVRLASFTITPYREQIIATHIAAAHRSGMLPSGNAARFLGVLRTSNDQLALRELGAEWSRRQAAAVRVAATSVRSRGPKSPLADRTSSSVSPA